MGKTDLRVVKTKINITNTFLQLLKEKEFDDITIQDLLDRAMINRSTFYRYYADKYALAESIASGFLKQFDQVMDKRRAKLDFCNILSGLDETLDDIAAHRDTLLALWKIRTERVHIEEDMRSMLIERFSEFHRIRFGSSEHSEYHSYLFTTLIIANCRFYLEHADEYTGKKMLEEMSDFFNFITVLNYRPAGGRQRETVFRENEATTK